MIMHNPILWIEILGRFIIVLAVLFYLVELNMFGIITLFLASIMLCLWIANPIYKKMNEEWLEKKRARSRK